MRIRFVFNDAEPKKLNLDESIKKIVVSEYGNHGYEEFLKLSKAPSLDEYINKRILDFSNVKDFKNALLDLPYIARLLSNTIVKSKYDSDEYDNKITGYAKKALPIGKMLKDESLIESFKVRINQNHVKKQVDEFISLIETLKTDIKLFKKAVGLPDDAKGDVTAKEVDIRIKKIKSFMDKQKDLIPADLKEAALTKIKEAEESIKDLNAQSQGTNELEYLKKILEIVKKFKGISIPEKRLDLITLMKSYGDINATENNVLNSAFKYLTKLYNEIPEVIKLAAQKGSSEALNTLREVETILQEYNEAIKRDTTRKDVTKAGADLVSEGISKAAKAIGDLPGNANKTLSKVLNTKVGINK